MSATPTAETFTKLLLSLDANRERAGEKYHEQTNPARAWPS
jgi:hypothetical protein